MNSLSWFLYTISVVENARICLLALGVMWILLLVARILDTTSHNILATASHNDGYDVKRKDAERRPYPSYWNVAPIVLVAILLTALPSQNTLYAIAASEAGEKIVKSEAVQGIASDAQKALHQWIKRQIEPEKKS